MRGLHALSAELRVRDEVDAGAVGVDEAGVQEAGFGRVPDRVVGAAVRVQDVELAVDGEGN